MNSYYKNNKSERFYCFLSNAIVMLTLGARCIKAVKLFIIELNKT